MALLCSGIKSSNLKKEKKLTAVDPWTDRIRRSSAFPREIHVAAASLPENERLIVNTSGGRMPHHFN